MAHHLEAIAAQEHRLDRTHLVRMCGALQDELGAIPTGDGVEGAPPDDGVAAAVEHALASLRDELDGGRIDREGARVRLRRLVALAGAVRGRDHAQSPAADPSRPVVDADPWDYRRDRHREGACWEQRWVDVVVRPASPSPGAGNEPSPPVGPTPPGRPAWPGRSAPLDPHERSAPQVGPSRPTALLTSCGMAAMTTVVALLERETGTGPILVDRATYHETRHIMATGALADRVHEVASEDLPRAIAELGAAAVVLDAVANSADVRVADLAALSTALDEVGWRATSGPAPLLVVDASVCSMVAEPVRRLLAGPDPCADTGSSSSEPRHRVVVLESLTKHAQLGLDRVAAGVIVARGRDARTLDALREHLGTNIADLTCLQLLPPDLELLDARLSRVGRNATLVADRLAAAGLPVVHPSRPGHPDHLRWRADRPSCGLVTLADDECPPDLLDRWLDRARARRVPLDHGAGFGFDTTRVYRTSATVPEATAFVRIAPGAEPIDAVLAVADVLAAGWR